MVVDRFFAWVADAVGLPSSRRFAGRAWTQATRMATTSRTYAWKAALTVVAILGLRPGTDQRTDAARMMRCSTVASAARLEETIDDRAPSAAARPFGEPARNVHEFRIARPEA